MSEQTAVKEGISRRAVKDRCAFLIARADYERACADLFTFVGSRYRFTDRPELATCLSRQRAQLDAVCDQASAALQRAEHRCRVRVAPPRPSRADHMEAQLDRVGNQAFVRQMRATRAQAAEAGAGAVSGGEPTSVKERS